MATEKHIIDIEAKDKGLKEINAGLRLAKEEFIRAVNEFGRYSAQARNAEDKLRGFIGQQKEANRLLREVSGAGKLGARGFLEMAENLTTVISGLSSLAGKVSSFVRSSITEFTAQENSLLQLKAVTGENIGLFDRLKTSAESLQGRFGIPDEEIQSVQAFLVTQGRNETQIKKIIEASRLLAIVQGTDLRSATEKIDGTFEGVTGKLGKLDGRIKDLSDEELTNGRVADILIEKYSVLGNSIENSAGTKLKRLEVGFKEFKEGAGEVLFDAIQPLVDAFNGLGFKADEVGKIVVRSITGFGTLVSVVKTIKQEFESFNKVITDVINSFSDMAGNLPVAGSVFETLSQYALSYQDALLGVIGLQRSVVSFGADREGSVTAGDNKFIGTAKEPTANLGTLFKPKTTGKNTTQKEKDLLGEALKLVEVTIKNYELKDKLNVSILNTQLEKVKSLYAETLSLEDQNRVLEKQKAITEQIANITKSAMEEFAKTQNMFAPFLFGNAKNRGVQVGSSRDVTMETAQGTIKETGATWQDIYNTSNNMLSNFAGMFQYTELSKTGFGQVLQWLQQFLSTANSTSGFLGNIFDIVTSFIPGASAVTSIAKGAGSSIPIPTSNVRVVNNQPIILKNMIDGMTLVRETVNPNTTKLTESYA